MLWIAGIVLGIAGLVVLDSGGGNTGVPWWVGLVLIFAAILCAVLDRLLPGGGD